MTKPEPDSIDVQEEMTPRERILQTDIDHLRDELSKSELARNILKADYDGLKELHDKTEADVSFVRARISDLEEELDVTKRSCRFAVSTMRGAYVLFGGILELHNE